MTEYVTLKYYFQRPKGDERFHDEESGWRELYCTREDALRIIKYKTLDRAKL